MALPLLGAFLATSIGALAKRALLAIGLGTITYSGLQAAFNAAQTQIINNYGLMPSNALALADLAGVGAAIGILLGALAARVGIAVVAKFGRVL